MGGPATSNRRAIRLLAAGGLVSGLGDMAAITALAFVIYRETGSAMWLALVFVINFGITGLLSPLAGLLADRLERRRLLIFCELASAALFVVLARVSQPLVMVLILLVASVGGEPIFLAFAAAVPNLVDSADLSWANSLASMAGQVGRMVGPALGGAAGRSGRRARCVCVRRSALRRSRRGDVARQGHLRGRATWG